MTSPSRRMARRLAAAVSLSALALGATACSQDEPERDTTPASSESKATDPAPTATDSPTDQPSASEPPAPPASTALPIYFAGDSGGGTRLFREFAPGSGGDALSEAAEIVDGGQPVDPDYRTLWPGGTIASVEATDGLLLVRLEADAFTEAPDGMPAKEARLAIQQLVYTLQGVQQERVPVQFVRDTGPARLFGIDVSAPVQQEDVLSVLNLVSITSPEQGATVSGDTLTVTGVANSFEASGPCRLLAGDQEVALVGYQAEGWMEDKLFPFEVELPLADAGSGELTVQCETDDPTGGTEGTGPDVDTKQITLE